MWLQMSHLVNFQLILENQKSISACVFHSCFSNSETRLSTLEIAMSIDYEHALHEALAP